MNANILTGFNYVSGALRYALQLNNHERILASLKLLGDMLNFYRKYWRVSVDKLYEDALRMVKRPEERLALAAIEALGRDMLEAAICFSESASAINPEVKYRVEYLSFLIKGGRIEQARQFLEALGVQFPGNQSVSDEQFACSVAEKFWACDYYDLLAEIHTRHTPNVYLEIGVATGKSMALVKQSTTAVGIDPSTAAREMLAYLSPENNPQFYRMTSDDFFANQDVEKAMGKRYFDVAFIDGLHHFDQVLRDFINLEKFAGPNSLILIHDCLPIDRRVATKERATLFWTGDVWRIIPCLQTVRPDLEIVTLPLPPSGLALVRRMNPASTVLSRHYSDIVEEFEKMGLPESWEDRCKLLAVNCDQSAFRVDHFFPKGGWP